MKEYKNSKGDLLSGKASIDMPHLKFMPKGASEILIPEISFYEYIYKNNEKYPNMVALEYFFNKITMNELFNNVDNMAKSFVAAGIKRGDTVSLVMPTIPEFVYGLLALNKIGVRADLTNFLLDSEEDIKYVVNRSNPKYMVIMNDFYGKFKNTINELPIEGVVTVSAVNSALLPIRLLKNHEYNQNVKRGNLTKIPKEDSRFITYKDFIKSGKQTKVPDTAPFIKDEPAVLVSSSGTTGFPKGINISNNGLVSTLHTHVATDGEFHRGLSSLNIIPSFYLTTLASSLLLELSYGVKLILDPRFDRNIFAKQLLDYKPNYCLVNSNHWEAILTDPILDGVDLSFLKYPITGGDAISPDLEMRLNQFFKEHTLTKGIKPAFIRKGWGLSELGAAVTYDHYDSKLGSSGKAFPHYTIGVFNPDTDLELNYNEYGEIRVITPSKMVGYDKDPEKTNEVFKLNPHDNKTWGRSFDVGHIDEDGNIFIDGPRGLTDSIKNENEDRVYGFLVDNALALNKEIEFTKTVSATIYDELLDINKEVLITHIKFNGEITLDKLISLEEEYLFDLNDNTKPFAFKIINEIPIAPSGKKDIDYIRRDKEGLIKIIDGKIYNIEINNENNMVILNEEPKTLSLKRNF